jgi:GNAT superfamily N-acetyltransferase
MRHWTRPDGRCFVFGEPDDDLPLGRVYATAEEADEARVRTLAGLGFAIHRRELVLELPTDAAAWRVPAVETPPRGVAFVRADRFAEERLRELDDLLRQDVPGTGAWKWSREGFREETYDSPDFDPATYLVALDEASEGVGIARIWMRRDGPRLGLIAVRSDSRRRGVARAMLAAVLTEVARRGVATVRTEVDETNTASRELLFGFGGRAIGASLELVREGGLRLRQSVAEDAEAIAAVQVRSAQAGFAHFRPPGALDTLDPALRVPLWRERLPLVAESEKGIVGFAHIGPSEAEPVGEIYRFFVAPEHWREGVGQALMARALEQLREKDFLQAILWVHAENGRARRFYEAAGWRPDGAERDEEAFGEIVKELRYRIELC